MVAGGPLDKLNALLAPWGELLARLRPLVAFLAGVAVLGVVLATDGGKAAACRLYAAVSGSELQRWEHTAISPKQWKRLTNKEKRGLIQVMYNKENGTRSKRFVSSKKKIKQPTPIKFQAQEHVREKKIIPAAKSCTAVSTSAPPGERW